MPVNPDDPLQAAIREAYATARSDVYYLDTLEISNAAAPTLYLVRDRIDQNLTLEDSTVKTFVACGFRFQLPAAGDNGLQELSLAVDNVDRKASEFVSAALGSNAPIEVVYRPYLSSDLTQPQMNPPLRLFLTDVVITSVEINGRAQFADILNRKFLSESYVRRRFPAL
jgi:hypothetical protein